MVEWLAFGLSAICAIGSFVAFLLAQKEKREAKESGEKAREYAEDANKANLEIQKYVQFLNGEIDEQKEFIAEKEKVKQYLSNRSKQGQHNCNINDVYQELYNDNADKNLLLKVLKELETDGMINEKDVKTLSDNEYKNFIILRDY